MNFYYLIPKIGSFFFWGIVLPVGIVFVSRTALLPVIYFFESRVAVQNSAIDVKQFSASRVLGTQTERFTLPVRSSGQLAITQRDYRALVLDQFFHNYHSPLEGYGDVFVSACDKYNAPFDCTTLPAIAYVETGLCTLDLSFQQKNCWGFGGSGPNRIVFNSFNDSIDLITNRLVNAYGPKYMTNPKLMQSTYCGPQCLSWGEGVQQKRVEIDRLAVNMGYPALIR